MKICENGKCVGCRLCSAVCPTNCITFELDNHGFFYPIIDEKVCISCNKCVKLCPSNNIAAKRLPRNCYAAWSNDDDDHYNCASAGLATAFSKYFICNKGVVVGSSYNSKLKLSHQLVSDNKGIDALKKSKYIQSYIPEELFLSIKITLDAGTQCLFIGVPCQCNALKLYLKHEYSNLLIIDLLCRGGASPGIFADHVAYLKNKYFISNLDNIVFRGGQHDCCFTGWNSNKLLYKKGQMEDEYFLSFMKRIIYRPACYQCQYATTDRVGDITLADFWGLDPAFMVEHSLDSGVNLLLVNSTKGQFFMEQMDLLVTKIERPVEEAIQGNDTLTSPTPMPENYKLFMNCCSKIGLEKAVHLIYYKHYFRIWLYRVTSKTLPAPIKSIIKKVIRK